MCKCCTAKVRFSGQWPVDQQCDLLWRETRQMRHQHHCHHRKCLNGSSRGKFSLKKNQLNSLALFQVVHHDYVDAPLAPQSEDWRLVSFPHPDYAFMMWSVRHRIEALKWPAKLKFKSKVWSLTRSGLCRWNCYKQASHCQGPA